jgi:succinate dehydrogenase flavin-adding protein (antitoxin of CptAB toxin-antitoxin module)
MYWRDVVLTLEYDHLIEHTDAQMISWLKNQTIPHEKDVVEDFPTLNGAWEIL